VGEDSGNAPGGFALVVGEDSGNSPGGFAVVVGADSGNAPGGFAVVVGADSGNTPGGCDSVVDGCACSEGPALPGCVLFGAGSSNGVGAFGWLLVGLGTGGALPGVRDPLLENGRGVPMLVVCGRGVVDVPVPLGEASLNTANNAAPNNTTSEVNIMALLKRLRWSVIPSRSG
jgi:hypothetical protein